jgi:hypothetical protein
MVVIQSASFGDPYSKTNVLDSLKSKFKDGNISVLVNSSLLPMRSWIVGSDTSLTQAEVKDARAKAVKACGAGGSAACVEQLTQDYAQERLRAKAAEATSVANVIQGRRLSLELKEANGQIRKVRIPEGQRFELGTITQKAPPKAFDTSTITSSSAWTTMSWIWSLIGGSILLFAYVSSVIITWMTYRVEHSRLFTAAMTTIAVLIPYSGFALSIAAAAFPELMRQWTLRRMAYEQKALSMS